MGIANFSSFKSLFLYYFNFEESIIPSVERLSFY